MLLRRLFGPDSLEKFAAAGKAIPRKHVLFDIDETLSKKVPMKAAAVGTALGKVKAGGLHSNVAWQGWNQVMRNDVPDRSRMAMARMYKERGYGVHTLSARGVYNRSATKAHFAEAGHADTFDTMMFRPLKHEKISDSGKYKNLRVRRHFGNPRLPLNVTSIYDDSDSVIKAAPGFGTRGVRVTPRNASSLEQFSAGFKTGKLAPYHQRGNQIDQFLRGKQKRRIEQSRALKPMRRQLMPPAAQRSNLPNGAEAIHELSAAMANFHKSSAARNGLQLRTGRGF